MRGAQVWVGCLAATTTGLLTAVWLRACTKKRISLLHVTKLNPTPDQDLLHCNQQRIQYYIIETTLHVRNNIPELHSNENEKIAYN